MASVPKEMSIYHEVDSTLFTPGHACYMLIHKSLIEEEDALQPNTVYLMSTQIGEKFPPLKDALVRSCRLTIHCYIELLSFFRDEWEEVKKRCNAILEGLNLAYRTPTVYDQNISLLTSSNILYEKGLPNNAKLKFLLHSAVVSSNHFVLLETPTQNIILHPAVMFEMAKKLSAINEEIFLAQFSAM